MDDFSFNLIHCVVFLFEIRHRIRRIRLICDLTAIKTYNFVDICQWSVGPYRLYFQGKKWRQ